RQVGGLGSRLRLLDHVFDLVQTPLAPVRDDDAGAAGLAQRKAPHREDRGPGLGMGVDQLLQAWITFAQDHVVGEQDGARLSLDEPARRPDGVPETKWLLLLDVGDVDEIAKAIDAGKDAEQVVAPPLAQVMLELERA